MKTLISNTKSIDELWQEYAQTRNFDVRQELLVHYLQLVKLTAGRMKTGLPNTIEYDDLVSSGLIGLMQCIDSFNPSKGFKFETFAIPRIRGAILDGLRESDYLSRTHRQRTKMFDQAVEKLTNSLGRLPNDNEIVVELGIESEEFDLYLESVGMSSLISLDTQLKMGDEGDTGSLYDIVQDENAVDPYAKLEREDIEKYTLKLIGSLSELERNLIALYYYEGLTFKEIGLVLGMTESRACQIHTKIISLLRAKLSKVVK